MLNFGYNIDSSGKRTSDTPMLFFGDEQATLEQVRPRLEQEAQFFKTIGTKMEDVTVEIRADAGVPAGMVQELIQMCQEDKIQFQRFALKATQKIDQ